jgi:diguanylate cyclase (GGDEF)-like protein
MVPEGGRRAKVTGDFADRSARDVPASRYVAAVATALIGIVASIVAYLAVENSQIRIAELKLAELAKNHQQVLNADLDRASNLLYTLRDYFESSDTPVSRSEYQLFAKNLRGRLTGLRDTGWAPRVAAGEREAFERAVRDGGFPDFEIWERTPDGKRVRAGDRPEYFPVLYIDPVETTPYILGFDIASDEVGAGALRPARETGGPAATPPLDLFVGRAKGFLSYIPVYDRKAGQDGNPPVLRGFVNAVFAIGPMIETILAAKTRPAGLDMYIFDADRPAGDRLIYWHSSRTRAGPAPVPTEESMLSGPHWQGTLHVADRTWGVIFASTDKLVINNAPWIAIVTLLAGLAMTAVIVAYLLFKLQRAFRLESLTASLRAANDDLLALRAAFNQLDIGIVLLDQGLQAEFINQKVRQGWNLTDEQIEAKPTFESLIRHGLDRGLFAEPPADAEAHVARLVARVRSGSPISEDFPLANGEVVRFRSVVSPGGGRMLSSSNVTDLVRQAEQLRVLANIDGMTGAANRRHFIERAEAEWRRFARYHQPLSLLALDIDLFKSINDRFGHDVGDEVIRAVAGACAESVRDCDVLGRMGGEEFAVLLPHSDLEHARIVAERVRRRVEQMRVGSGGQEVSATVSIGVAQAEAGMTDIGTLLKRADQALYAAKRSGRNCVIQAVADVGIDLDTGRGTTIAVGAR